MAPLGFATLLLWAPLFSLTAWNHGATATSNPNATQVRGEKKWGDQCNDTRQCGYDNALCTVGQRRVCACHPDFPATNNLDKCDVSRGINESCAFSEQCEMAVPKTECRGGRCACRSQLIPHQTNGNWSCSIRGEKKWGDQCNDTRQCGYDNALCTVGQRRVCACHPDFPATNNLDKCDVSRGISESCAFNEQCEMADPKTECREGLCVCRFGMTPQETNEKWSCRSVLGSPCNATHGCHRDDDSGEHALQCYNGKCQCKGIFMPEDGMCKKKIDVLHAKCSPRTDVCYADSEGPRRHCTNGSCECKSSFVIENAVCKQKINLLGAPCNATVDVCYLDEDGNQQKTHCKDGVCQCKAEFTLTSDKKCQKVKSGNNNAEARFVGRLAWIPLIAVISVIR